MAHLALLHTAPTLVENFDRLIQERSPGLPVQHLLKSELLDEARNSGLTTELSAGVRACIQEAARSGASVVLCTCSTIGGIAEEEGKGFECEVIRIDRPMARRAVETGPKITVAAALESTLGPTRDLILECADEQGTSVELTDLLCADAWEKYEAGDTDGYWTSIARDVTHKAEGDVVVLAQASMAGAAKLCADLPIPVLSSPGIGLEYAVSLMGR